MNNYVTVCELTQFDKALKTMIVDFFFFLFVNKSLICLWIFGMMQFDNSMLLLVCGTMLPSKSLLVLLYELLLIHYMCCVMCKSEILFMKH